MPMPVKAAPSIAGFDAIAMEVFANRLLSITETMAINMMRSSFSAQIKERRDFSVGLFDGQGRLVAQGTHIPVHLGSLMGVVEALLARYPRAEIRPGDAFISNDPYAAGGTHLPDIAIATPVFHGEELIAFVVNIGHHTDVGGAVPGSVSPTARSIFEEGLRIPAMRVSRQGEVDEDLLNLIALNSRLPEERLLDLRVQVATNERGCDAALELVRRMGVDGFKARIRDLLAYTKRRLDLRIAGLAEGPPSRFTAWLDDDGLPDGEMVPLCAAVSVENGKLVIDFAGSGPEARGAINIAPNALRATAYYCVKALLDPELMANSGMMDSIVLRAPEGSIVNPRSPAPVGSRTIACQRLAGAIFGAFQPLVDPATRIASAYDVLPSFSVSGHRPENGSFYICGETVGGGGGARCDGDGMDGIHVHVTNSLNLPTEALENEFPLHVEEYAFVQDSAGCGRWRGGMGIARTVRALHDRTNLEARSDRHKAGAPGAEGGLTGGKGRVTRNPGTGRQQALPSKIAQLLVDAGETIRIATPGGGGFGDPAQRPAALIATDLLNEIMTEDHARAGYGDALVDAALALLRDGRRRSAA
ncbi:hydantoinase B/oxoprolinase family protein [Bosea sp. SSUT16]|jgi:N-methylhydantoinase B|uniref:Hydantoinase B/oxoprolinase family protein n=1 Tax=Bosea spartocytisi TaxID=2773451 RepID=A0A927E7Z7_9HYPH|nr:hydantoinase B/oxoprolinase family protein [Bosea spartocytisi]MBD3846038.1 hydantoinase B/oxoprolinase family protein [Bosea spartocytisi]MCT4473222.1 hydantoinase B/oxoprolinase family protein [Bosea spartocytisi]